jgi:hypothetical protein
MKIVTHMDRSTDHRRSMVVDKLNIVAVTEIARANIVDQACLMTDDAGSMFTWVSTTRLLTVAVSTRATTFTNTIEGYFSIFKRGVKRVYQRCAKRRLHRYLADFDFRDTNRVALGYNDADRADVLLHGIIGKRLTYEKIGVR